MKIRAKQITITAACLAICILSQYFKNLSVYITGPIVNACLIVATWYAGLACGAILGIIAPITAFWFTGSPIMAGIPLMFPAIMSGNVILVFFTWLFDTKLTFKLHVEAGLICGAIVKALFMWMVIGLVLLPLFSSDIILPNGNPMPDIKVEAAKFTFSVVQLITALIGSAYARIIRIPLGRVMSE